MFIYICCRVIKGEHYIFFKVSDIESVYGQLWHIRHLVYVKKNSTYVCVVYMYVRDGQRKIQLAIELLLSRSNVLSLLMYPFISLTFQMMSKTFLMGIYKVFSFHALMVRVTKSSVSYSLTMT